MAAVAEVARDPKAFAKHAKNPKVWLCTHVFLCCSRTGTCWPPPTQQLLTHLFHATCTAGVQVQQFYSAMGNLVGSKLEKMDAGAGAVK